MLVGDSALDGKAVRIKIRIKIRIKKGKNRGKTGVIGIFMPIGERYGVYISGEKYMTYYQREEFDLISDSETDNK